MKKIQLILAMGAALLLTACNDKGSEPQEQRGEPLKLSAKQREVLDSSKDFAVNLLDAVAQDLDVNDNVNISPVSLSADLAMLTNFRLSEKAYGEVVDALGLNGYGIDEVNSAYNSLLVGLPSVDPASSISIGVSLWYSPFVAAEIDAVKQDISKQYGAHLEAVNLESADYVNKANAWAFNATNGKISNAASPIINGRVALLNALHFEGKWSAPFDKKLTREGTFTTNGGSKVTVQMMNNPELEAFAYFDDSDGSTMIFLPYGADGNIEMIIFMPKSGTDIREFASAVTRDRMIKLVNEGNKSTNIDLYMPKFKIASKFDFRETLKRIGVREIFQPKSMLINTSEQVGLRNLQQDTYINVDEEGTIASAVTVMEGASTGVNKLRDDLFLTGRSSIQSLRERRL